MTYNNFKITTIWTLLTFLFLFSVKPIFNTKYSRNIENIKEVKIGMNYQEVITKMENKHLDCIRLEFNCRSELFYNSGNDSNPYIKIKFNKNKVKDIYIPTYSKKSIK